MSKNSNAKTVGTVKEGESYTLVKESAVLLSSLILSLRKKLNIQIRTNILTKRGCPKIGTR